MGTIIRYLKSEQAKYFTYLTLVLQNGKGRPSASRNISWIIILPSIESQNACREPVVQECRIQKYVCSLYQSMPSDLGDKCLASWGHSQSRTRPRIAPRRHAGLEKVYEQQWTVYKRCTGDAPHLLCLKTFRDVM